MPCGEAIVDGLADAVKPIYIYLLYTPPFLRTLPVLQAPFQLLSASACFTIIF